MVQKEGAVPGCLRGRWSQASSPEPVQGRRVRSVLHEQRDEREVSVLGSQVHCGHLPQEQVLQFRM